MNWWHWDSKPGRQAPEPELWATLLYLLNPSLLGDAGDGERS